MKKSKWLSPRGNSYNLYFCGYCECFAIKCLSCEKSSCCGSSCYKCTKDVSYFDQEFSKIEDFLTEEELNAYDKVKNLKRLILNNLGTNSVTNTDSIKVNRDKLDFNELKQQGLLSKHTTKLFKNFIKKDCK